MTLKYRTISDYVLDYLRTNILNGKFKPGDAIDQNIISDEIKVSRTPIKTSLHELEAEGLVVLKPHATAIVAPLLAEGAEELYLMRYGLEEAVAVLGAEKIDENGLEKMADCLAKIDEIVKNGSDEAILTYFKTDKEFHRIHYLAAGKPRLWDRINDLKDKCQRYTRYFWHDHNSYVITADTHYKVLEACKKHDGMEAGKYIKIGLELTLQCLIKSINGNK